MSNSFIIAIFLYLTTLNFFFSSLQSNTHLPYIIYISFTIYFIKLLKTQLHRNYTVLRTTQPRIPPINKEH